MLAKFTYKRAASIQEAVEAAARPGARILAGGTDLLGCLRDKRVPGGDRGQHFRHPRSQGHQPAAGRRPAHRRADHPDGDRREPAGAAVISRYWRKPRRPWAARNCATRGPSAETSASGRRCWYFRGDFHCRRKGGDTCFAETGENQFHAILGWDRCYMVHPSDTASALAALGARVTMAGRKGRRTIPIESFFVLPKVSLLKENVLEPGELVTEILLDAPPPGARSTYRKVRERGAFDFALAGAAIVVTMAEGKVRVRAGGAQRCGAGALAVRGGGAGAGGQAARRRFHCGCGRSRGERRLGARQKRIQDRAGTRGPGRNAWPPGASVRPRWPLIAGMGRCRK